jgi:beta-glucosidase
VGQPLSATWDTDWLRKGGVLQRDEAIAKGACVLLDPTVNMQPSRLGGRGSKSFSGDPTVAGKLGCATVKGIQSNGVLATMKYFFWQRSETQVNAP